MSHFAHRASRRAAEVESEFEHARYIAVPALLWAVAAVVAVACAAFQGVPENASAQPATAEDAPITLYGA